MQEREALGGSNGSSNGARENRWHLLKSSHYLRQKEKIKLRYSAPPDTKIKVKKQTVINIGFHSYCVQESHCNKSYSKTYFSSFVGHMSLYTSS